MTGGARGLAHPVSCFSRGLQLLRPVFLLQGVHMHCENVLQARMQPREILRARLRDAPLGRGLGERCAHQEGPVQHSAAVARRVIQRTEVESFFLSVRARTRHSYGGGEPSDTVAPFTGTRLNVMESEPLSRVLENSRVSAVRNSSCFMCTMVSIARCLLSLERRHRRGRGLSSFGSSVTLRQTVHNNFLLTQCVVLANESQ